MRLDAYWRRKIPTGVVVRLLITTAALTYLGARYGIDRAVELGPAVASTVDTIGRWFGRR